MSQQNAAPVRKRAAAANAAAPAAEPKPKVRAATNAMANAVTVKPVSNAIRILRYLTQTGAPERAADIARHLSINSSTCFNILRTLVAEDVVDFNALSKTYSAGLGLARLVEQLVTQGQRLQLAAPPMQDLAAEFGVTVTLWRRLGADRIVLVSSQSSPTNLRIDMPAGQRLPILMGASGRLFAGRLGLTEAQLREEFEQLRWVRAISFDNYLREVNRARRRGWASDDGYFATGVLAIAAPVCDPSGNIAFTVSTVMIRGDRSEDKVEVLGEAVRDLGHKLEAVLF
ncbi:IclR family transcriptional regulator [Cupriavidus sp. CV2]|uniref:IclR family transcriptional regulator n=1 Tax=Cupriavidus ulmosensis TaxID=3065913 RepID=UPI00296B0CB7|nr:IclR family transcriptional regulator [Cupriavidus sp. CV2]MDW3682363.1 IclR family transcriptional regulator [Cupriavidus sp. CV2]